MDKEILLKANEIDLGIRECENMLRNLDNISFISSDYDVSLYLYSLPEGRKEEIENMIKEELRTILTNQKTELEKQFAAL